MAWLPAIALLVLVGDTWAARPATSVLQENKVAQENKVSLAAAEKTLDSVISKVVEMLGENKDKIAADVASEAKEMAEYSSWCDDEITETGFAIRTADRKINDLKALIEDHSAQVHALDEEVTSLGSELAERQEEIDEANKLRKKQNADFKKNEEEQTLMIEELEKMEIELKRQMDAMTTPPPVAAEGDAEAAPASSAIQYETLVQLKNHQPAKKASEIAKLQQAMAKMVNAVWVDPDSKQALGKVNGFMQADGLMQSMDEPTTPVPMVEVSAEAFGNMQENTGSNLAAFEMLKGKAEESLQKMQAGELTEKHSHDMRIQSLMDAIHLAEGQLDDVKRDHARLATEQAKAEGDLQDTSASKLATKQALAELKLQCHSAGSHWEKRQKEATEEMAAIGKAKEILASRVTVMVQTVARQPVDQTEDPSKVAAIQKMRKVLVDHFRRLGDDLHSLAMLNLVSVATSEPLGQVKGLLKDLIVKLTNEAAEASNLHEFCKEEKAKTKEAKEEKIMKVDSLAARRDKAATKQAELEEGVAELQSEIAAMEAADSEALRLRTEEHATFSKAESDYKEAAAAVGDAIDALKDYYGSTALIQDPASMLGLAQPRLGGAKSESTGGIVSILDTIQGEFMRTVASMQSDEREAVKAYDKMKQDNRVAKAANAAEIKGAQSEIKSLTVAIHNFSADHKMASEELQAIMDYIDKLRPQCEGRVTPYAERKARRDAEIQGLKDALGIMEQGAPSFVQVRRLRHTTTF